MRVDLYPEFLELLHAAQKIVAARKFFLWKLDSEPEPESIDLSFRPAVAEKVVERTLDKNACVLCARRISYKKNQFAAVQPAKPYLFLVHNDFLSPRAGFYNDPEENALFERMIEKVLGFSARDALVREILRCHFSKEDTGDIAALQNCATHIRHDIERAQIRGILIVGQAASLLWPDKKQLSELQDKVFDWSGVKTMVLPGPHRLIYMRKKGFPREQIDAERKKIFSILTTFRGEIIEKPT